MGTGLWARLGSGLDSRSAHVPSRHGSSREVGSGVPPCAQEKAGGTVELLSGLPPVGHFGTSTSGWVPACANPHFGEAG